VEIIIKKYLVNDKNYAHKKSKKALIRNSKEAGISMDEIAGSDAEVDISDEHNESQDNNDPTEEDDESIYTDTLKKPHGMSYLLLFNTSLTIICLKPTENANSENILFPIVTIY
jgi:hypothetical protein